MLGTFMHGIRFFHTLKVALICNKGYYTQQELQMPVSYAFTINNTAILIPAISAE
jgi:hypothetical protein